MAPSHVHRSALQAGAAASSAVGIKSAKYAALAVAHDVVPTAIETLGTWGPAGLAFINELGKKLSAVSGDSRATAFLAVAPTPLSGCAKRECCFSFRNHPSLGI